MPTRRGPPDPRRMSPDDRRLAPSTTSLTRSTRRQPTRPRRHARPSTGSDTPLGRRPLPPGIRCLSRAGSRADACWRERDCVGRQPSRWPARQVPNDAPEHCDRITGGGVLERAQIGMSSLTARRRVARSHHPAHAGRRGTRGPAPRLATDCSVETNASAEAWGRVWFCGTRTARLVRSHHGHSSRREGSDERHR